MAKEFLDYYEEHMADHSRLFDGVPEMLQDIEAQGAVGASSRTNMLALFTL